MALSARGYAPKYFGLDLGSANAGWLRDFKGGNAQADVVTESIGVSNVQQKHISNVSYQACNLTCGLGMGTPFFKWIDGSFTAPYVREPQGAVHACDTDFNNISSLNFFNALVTSVGYPACDVSSKDGAALSVGFQPEYTRNIKGGGKYTGGKADASKQRMITPANFRLKLDNLADACVHVSKVDALSLTQTTINNYIGEKRDYEVEPGTVSCSNLSVTFAESHADAVYTYHENFVIKGQCGQDKEITGSLEYLSKDLATTLFTLEFTGVGIFNLTPDPLSTGSDKAIRNVKADFYITTLKHKLGAGSWA